MITQTEVRQNMQFILPNTEEVKIEFTRWVSTCPKSVHAYYTSDDKGMV